MADVIAYLTGNLEGLMVVLFAVHALALAVVNLTPTPKDDAIVAKLYSVLEVVAGLVSKRAKE
jgi:hypothetical protein